MRRRIVISSVVIFLFLALAAGIGHFVLGWWQPSHQTIIETSTVCDSVSQTCTLQEAMATAHQALDQIEHNVRDYSAVIVKTERIDDKPITTVMFAKIREKPFSVYLYFLDRSDTPGIKGREVVFAQGRNDDKLLVHTTGLIAGRFTVPLDPKTWPATKDEHYPITEIGLANLCRQLIKRGDAAGDPGQVQVKRFSHARINSRKCTLLEIVYPVQEPKNLGYLARVFVDGQWKIPIRVEVYELPKEGEKGPQLVEEYTYLDLKLNNGYSDLDFDPKNRQYKFP